MKIEKALVVDDSKVAHLNLRKLLTERGVEVDWVGSGEDCLTYLKRQKPDVVFMDVMMPGMDGFDTTGAINSDPSIEAPPVVICSANASDEDRQNARKNGAIEFLSKPYTPAKLDQILASIGQVAANNGDGPQPESAATEEAAVVEPEKPRSEPEKPRAVEPEKPVAPVVDFSRIMESAEQAARSTAEETARKVTTELVKLAAEKTIRMGVKEAESVAREVARTLIDEMARAIAEETAQAVAERAARQVGNDVLQDVMKQVASASEGNGVVDLDSIREDLQAQVSQQLQAALSQAMAGDDFKQQLVSMVKENLHPLVETTARETAAQTARQTTALLVEEATRPVEENGKVDDQAALSRANIALGIGILAIVVAAALKFLV